jgi:transcriptional regulator with XRE-family HTH domain
MSYFRVALQRETERRNLTQSDLAKAAALSRSYVSRLLSGDHADLSDDNFVAILKVFGADKRAQAELVAARCMDARVGPGADLVEIKIKDTGKTGDGDIELPDIHLSKETERAFAWLRSQCPANVDLEKHLISYARLTGMK